MLWLNLREEEFEQAVKDSGGVCLLPIGCVEKHGQHLPMGTDVFLAEEYARLASDTEPAVVFPCMTFGQLYGAEWQKGSVILSPQLMMNTLEELCDEIGRNGFNKIVLFNGHGGNMAWLNFFQNSTIYKKKDYLVYIYSVELGPPEEIWESVRNGTLTTKLNDEELCILERYCRPEDGEWGHSCPFETAAIMGLKPEVVRLDKADESGHSTYRMRMDIYPSLSANITWGSCYPNSFSGENPNKITPGIAALEVEYVTKKAVEAIRRVKEEQIGLKVNREMNEFGRK